MDPTDYATPGVHEVTLPIDGVDRVYELLVPASYDGSKPVPLVLAFHGFTMTPSQMIRGSWGELAEEYGFVLAAPAGLDKQWAVAQTEEEAAVQLPTSEVDLARHPKGDQDVLFAAGVLADVTEFLRVDSDRIFVTGESLGGFMASRVACELGEHFAGLGPNYNSLLYSQPCSTDVDFAVVTVGHAQDSVHTIEDAEAAALLWAQHNGCKDGDPVRSEFGENIERAEFESCPPDTPVVMVVHEYSWAGEADERVIWETFEAIP